MSEVQAGAAQPKSGTLYGIQVLRAVAATLVVFRHVAKAVTGDDPNAFAHGQFGVDIFFVISGVVIYLTGRKLSPGQFLSRRLTRIVPLYWIALVLTILGDHARHKMSAFSLTNAISSFFFIPSHDTATSVFPPIVVGWSLNYEMYFYIVCALAILVAGGARMIWVASAIIGTGVVAGAAMSGFLHWQDYPIAVLLLPITLEFLAGMFLAHAHVQGRNLPRPFAIGLIAAAILWVVLAPTATPYTALRPLFWGIPAIAIVAAFIGLEPHVAAFRWRPALELGDSSYALYLVHPMVIGVMMAVLGKLHLHEPIWLRYTMIVVVALCAGLVVHRVVERPLLKLLGRWTRGRPAAPAATASADTVEPAPAA